MPGESYQADDVELFARIDGALHARPLSRASCLRLWNRLRDPHSRARRPGPLLSDVVDELPELQFVHTAFVSEPARTARALGMLLISTTAHLRAIEARQTSSLPPKPKPSGGADLARC